MGRLDLPDVYRDEDCYWPNDYVDLRGDAGNPGTRQVPAPPAKGGAGSSVSALPESGRSGARPLGFSDSSVDSPLMVPTAGDSIVRGTTEEFRSCGDPSGASPVSMEHADGSSEGRA